MATGKLQSLQGLRGVAICLVIVFHLFPDAFTNGFVGVDMFFVLSGYLMTRILSKRINLAVIIDFYKKRFNRIVPLFYLTILVTIFAVLCLVLKSERKDFIFDVSWSLPLVSNIQPIFEHHSYWEQVSAIRYLTHLWSLCTELQYYLMAPLIHIIAMYLPFPNRIAAYLIAIGILATFQLLTPFELSYCFLASRVWQFLMGSVAFELWKHFETRFEEHVACRKKEERLTPTDLFPSIFFIALCVIVAFPEVFNEHVTRWTMTFAAACFCFLCGHLESTIFSWSPLVFIGNLSYVIYLIHWPVINFTRYIQQRDNTGLTATEALEAVAMVAVLSLLAHYFVEKRILKLDFPINLTITFFLFGLCYAMIPFLKNQECLAMKTLPDVLIDEANFNLNETNLVKNITDLPCDSFVYNANCTYENSVVEYCEHKGDGSGTVLVLGNSLAIRAFPTIFNLLNGRYREIRLFAKHGSGPLFNVSKDFNEEALRLTEQLRPEMLWFVQGMNEIAFHTPESKFDISPESLNRVVQDTMDQFKRLADMVVVDLPYFVTKNYPAKLTARSLIYRKDLNDISEDLETVDEQVYEHTERLKTLNCSNCDFVDVQKALTGGRDKFYYFQDGTTRSLNYDGSHLTKTAYTVLEPLYQEKINNFLMIMKMRNFVELGD